MKIQRRRGYGMALLLGLAIGAASGSGGVSFDAQTFALLGDVGDGFEAAGDIATRAWSLAAELEIPDLPDLPELPELPELRLEKVEFVGLDTLRPATLLDRTELPGSGLLADVDTGAICAAITGHARVRACTAMRLPPNRLIVGVYERSPLAIDRKGAGLDATGSRFPLAPGERKALPRVHGDIAAALDLLVAAQDAGVAVERVDARASRDISFRPEGMALRVRVGRDPVRELEDWTRLRQSGLLERHQPQEVDLRFKGSAVLRGTEAEGGKRSGSK